MSNVQCELQIHKSPHLMKSAVSRLQWEYMTDAMPCSWKFVLVHTPLLEIWKDWKWTKNFQHLGAYKGLQELATSWALNIHCPLQDPSYLQHRRRGDDDICMWIAIHLRLMVVYYDGVSGIPTWPLLPDLSQRFPPQCNLVTFLYNLTIFVDHEKIALWPSNGQTW